MKHLFPILAFGYLMFSCSKENTKKSLDEELSGLKGWNTEIQKGSVDTAGVKNWLPEPEVKVNLTKTEDLTCLTPSLDFYPIELEKYIEKKLMNYLTLRSTLYPPAPKTYTTEKYLVLGWNMTDFGDWICCECSELESTLMTKLQLQPKLRPKEWEKFILQEK